jgi:hypothetical protein
VSCVGLGLRSVSPTDSPFRERGTGAAQLPALVFVSLLGAPPTGDTHSACRTPHAVLPTVHSPVVRLVLLGGDRAAAHSDP